MRVEKPHYDSCDYNSKPIGDVLEELWREGKLSSANTTTTNTTNTISEDKANESGVAVLEVASGSGQHAVYMTRRFPPNTIARWVCTDLPEMLPGITRWLQEDGKHQIALVKQPYALNFTDTEKQWREMCRLAVFPHIGYDLVFTANSFHIAPWEACCSLFRRLPLVVRPGGLFIVYGAFNYNGTFTSDSNRRFDAWLKQNHPYRGIRDKETVESMLAQQGFTLEKDYDMPDNNRCLCFRRQQKDVETTQ
ncbi:methylase [Trypanosoma theileri]|uniref:Methylase n=1 Tax=Trypanosoma theileri TaxID=67003 RepID=A0A1X0NDY5_9TRYP|nr:methylase [Trypanosoma theileri]ORC81575.1 methylase [Trypanosoma theileri]